MIQGYFLTVINKGKMELPRKFLIHSTVEQAMMFWFEQFFKQKGSTFFEECKERNKSLADYEKRTITECLIEIDRTDNQSKVKFYGWFEPITQNTEFIYWKNGSGSLYIVPVEC